jgi:hypothetical protein
VRELRELVRYRAELGRLGAGLKTQVRQVLGKGGVIPELDGIFHGHGPRWFDELHLGGVYVERIESLRELIDLYDRQIRHCDAFIHRASRVIPAIRRCRRCAVSARFSPRCSSPRSVTSLRQPAAVALVGRADTPAARVRQPQPSRSHHQ